MTWRLGSSQATLTRLAVYLGILAGLAAVLGIVFLANSAPDVPLRELGKWFMQVALVFVGTGVVSVLVRQSELSRARRDAWADSLHELIGAHDEVQMAARLLSAHATARTYADQIKVLTSARGTLRRLSSAPEVQEDQALHKALLAMRKYLKEIIKEYQAKYLPVARQQRLDEAVLDVRLKRLAESNELPFPILPAELAERLPAGRAIEDAQQFPRLNQLRTGFKASKFRAAYEIAKPVMQKRAGMPVEKGKAIPPPRSGATKKRPASLTEQRVVHHLADGSASGVEAPRPRPSRSGD
jgi:hypothetical protein